MRKNVDDHVYAALANEWRKSSDSGVYKIRSFEPQLPRNSPSTNELYRYGD